ncbi:hypothetical protein JXA12_02465 [Candidatus Woesearchaeota archaeon]|nr:hypothetical protein [Candidatus Woesearchaeota archaeon]
MRFGGKSFSYYWPAIRWPVFLLAGWYVAGYVVSKVSVDSYFDIFGNPLAGYLVPGLLFLVAGYLVCDDCEGKQQQSAWGGALTALLVSAVIIVSGALQASDDAYMDATLERAVEKASAKGQDISVDDIPAGILRVSIIIGLVFTPVIYGLIGALFGWLGFLVAKHLC